MRLNYKRSGFDVRENRVVEARQQGVEQDVLNRVIADLPLEWHREAVKLIQITGCRRNEIENMTMKLTGRGNRATITIEWVVSKQKNGKENFNKITLHQEHFPDEFKELGTMLLHRNGCNSLRNSTFEKVRVFDDTRQNGEALAKAFQRSRRKLGLNKDLYKLHSLRHQLGTDLRNSGMDDLGIAHRLGQKLYKNANIYGINK